MHCKSRLNYVLVILAVYLTIGKAQEDNYDEEMRKFMEIYGKPNADDQAKADNLPYFVDFLNRYSDRIPAELKAHFQDLKASLMIPDDDTQVLVDGVPLQGGRWGKAFRSAARDVGVQTTSNVLTDFFYRIASWFASFFSSN